MTELNIFEIPLESGRIVYMKFDLHSTKDAERTVICFDPRRFLRAWGNYPYALGNPDSWRNDYKFHYAEDGFSFGISNPVPLAFVGGLIDGKIKLDNGITRTMWLLANGAKYFPMDCPGDIAEDLQLIAGVII
jgi:hypothetical protein